MRGKIFCPNPNCRRELEPYAEKCPYCKTENLNRMFLTKEEYEEWENTHKWPEPKPAPRPPRPPAPRGSRLRYSPPSQTLPKARVFAGGRCMWILRENGKLYKLDNSGAQARKVLEDNINYGAAEGSNSFFYLTKDGKQKFWRDGNVSFWNEDGLQPSKLYAGEDFALLLTKSGELYRFDQEKRRRIATDVRSAAAGKTWAVYVTRDGSVQSDGGNCDFSKLQSAREVYADGCSDAFWIWTLWDGPFLCGDGSRNRGTDGCIVHVFTGTGSEDPDCRCEEYGGYDENSPEDRDICHRLWMQFGKQPSIHRCGGPDYNQELPNVYGACYTYSFEDRAEIFGPVNWLGKPVLMDCKFCLNSFDFSIGTIEFRRDNLKKVVRFADDWGVLEVDGTLSLLAGGKKRSTVQDVFDIAVTAEDTVILSKMNGEVLCGPAEKLLKNVYALRKIQV